jgi:hypothetical protein
MTSYTDKSEQITQGIRKSFQGTARKVANRCCYGYDSSPNGEVTVNQAEAKVVRLIFERYLTRDSLGKIDAVEKQGVLSPTGKAKWNRATISKVLSNEKYTGSVLLQKTMSFCGIQLQNAGELNQVLIKGHREAIISPIIFKRVQQIKIERSKTHIQDCGIKILL